MPALSGVGRGVESLFGGGNFGIQVSKCVTQMMNNVTAFVASILSYPIRKQSF